MAVEDLSRVVSGAVSGDEMRKHLEALNRLHRKSGSRDDFRAVDYIVDCLSRYGVRVQVHELMSLISYPVSAGLKTASPVGREFACKTRALSGSTPPGGIRAEVVAVAKKDGSTGILGRNAGFGGYGDVDLKGKIVLTDRAGPDAVLDAQRAGAVGLINSWPSGEDCIHEMIASPVWGTPTMETAAMLPRIPSVSVKKRDGDVLREMCARGPVEVILSAESDTAWRRLRIPVAQIDGSEQPEKFVLVGGHLDSWHEGITDNATGNAAMLEMARVFNLYRDHLKRSVRFAWWAGHSYGRYSGSTWYNDNFWLDIYENCLGYNNVDSPGCAGATVYSEATAMTELASVVRGAVEQVTGQKCRTVHPTRAADQSFWGTGVPSMFFLMGNLPESARAMVGGSAGGWWWHSEYDTIDKADIGILAQDTAIYSRAVLALACADLLPYRFSQTAAEIIDRLTEYASQSMGRLSFTSLNGLADGFGKAASRVDAVLDGASASLPVSREANNLLVSAVRALVPVLYTKSGPFYQDPAIPIPFIPGLFDVHRIRDLEGKDEQYLLLTGLSREQNRLAVALKTASDCLERAASLIAGR
ncbi:MAG: M28 family peptidase [Ignavibacteriales bacterium]